MAAAPHSNFCVTARGEAKYQSFYTSTWESSNTQLNASKIQKCGLFCLTLD